MALIKLNNRSSEDNAIYGRRNLIINGAMQVAQRNVGPVAIGSGYYTIDRYRTYKDNDGASTSTQETSIVPTGFTNALKIQTTTADSSLAANQRLLVFTRCEGNSVSHLNWGTSNAKNITISFYVRSSVTGTHGGAVGNGSDNRNYPFTYTISTANTWERKIITIPGDTTGTWATNNTRSLQVVWGLGVGSTYSAPANAWASGDINSANGATTDVLGTLNATWYLTGVQLEVGEIATPFEHRSYGEELSLCQRYYQTFENNQLQGSRNTGTRLRIGASTRVDMRANPAISRPAGTTVIFQTDGSSLSSTNTTAAQGTTSSPRMIAFDLGGFTGAVDRAYTGAANYVGTAVFVADAEL